MDVNSEMNALHQKVAEQAQQIEQMREALEGVMWWLKCQEGGDEYPSDGCHCNACNLVRKAQTALAAAPAPFDSVQR